jgi:aflatoxin B1 aldehyde reductase
MTDPPTAAGLSNFTAWQTVQIFYKCREEGWVTPSVYQGKYNALCRTVEYELLPALRSLGIKFYAYSPLAGA